MCNGDIFDMFHRLSNMTAANILMRLPEDAPECVKTECIAEFEKGRIHIFFGLTLKLGCFLVPPLRIGAATHHHREASVAAIRICLDAEPNHYRLRQLQSEPVLSEALAYIQGEELQNLPMLQMYIAELRFAFSAERYVEGGHAVVYMHGGHARNRCESYDSLHLRVCEIERCMDSDPNFLIELADILLEARSPENLPRCWVSARTHPRGCPRAGGIRSGARSFTGPILSPCTKPPGHKWISNTLPRHHARQTQLHLRSQHQMHPVHPARKI